MNFFLFKENKSGFGLIETIISVALFVIVSFMAYGGFSQLMKGLTILEIKNTVIALANEKIEIARNLPYNDLGTIDGVPEGKIPQEENVVRNNYNLNVITAVRNIDDEFDGTFEEGTDDSPNDYKLVQIDITCQGCSFEETMTFYTKISSQNSESIGSNGALYIRAFDSFGQPIQGANVSIYNDQGTTTIDIDDVTDAEGYLKVIGVPPGDEAYEIIVTKDGYSTDRTYETGLEANPIPDRPHLNVLAGEITSASFSIDELSYLSLSTREETCSPVPNIDFNVHGSKTIGYDVYKYDGDLNSGSNSRIDIIDVEWDNYYISLIDDNYQLYGASSILPITVNPDTTQSINLIVGDKDPNMLLVQVKDTGTGLPLSGATVTLTNGSYEETKTTGNGFIRQTDWSGGPSQEFFSNQTKFDSSDNNIDYSVAGELTLDEFDGEYVSSGYLESSIFDLGTTSNFVSFSWLNQSQPASTTAKFQIATNEIVNATTTWDFVGPNGSSDGYYINAGDSVYSGHNGDRYLRYKVFLETENATSTPLVSDVSFIYSSDCIAPGQVMFEGLDTDTYEITVERDGYTTFQIVDLEVDQDWELLDVPMTQ